MRQKGNNKETAVLRTMIHSDAQNFATKRLLKDLDQIQRETIPTVGVTARPLEHDLFIWHANIKGPEGTPYEGGVFHLELEIPQSYPHQPPQVNLCTELTHPNVFGKQISLDMLQPTKGKDGKGWTSAYSIQSILLQLQSFLFEEIISEEDTKKTEVQIKKAVKAANEYKCPTRNCKHGGKLSLWPQFNSREQDKDAFIMTFNEQQLFETELVCYHTKLPYRSNKIQNQNEGNLKKLDSCLGILLSVSKIPRTGLVKQALPSHDYISIKAFINEGIKWDSMNINYTHWLPLYFGVTDNKERVLHLCEHAISMIMTNQTKRFNPEHILEVFPKITLTIVVQIMDQKTHASIRYLRLLAHIHALWLLLMEKYPHLYEKVEAIIADFVNNEKSRHKDVTQNIGIIFNLLYVAPKSKYHDVIQKYQEESLDRQVFWLLKEIPELGDTKLASNILPEQRVSISFKQQITSFQISCFQKIWLEYVKYPFKSTTEMFDKYSQNFCKLTTENENQLQQKVFSIFDNVKDYDSYHKFIEVKPKSVQEMDIMLKQAVINSKAKKYHGTLVEINELPDSEVQIKIYQSNLPKLEDVYQVIQTKIQGQKNKYETTVKELKTGLQDADWKKMCQIRWEWINNELYWNSQISANEICELANQRTYLGYFTPKERLHQVHIQALQIKNSTYEGGRITFPQQDWRQIFVKLDLEEFLNQIDLNPNFKALYSKIHIAKDTITNLMISLNLVGNLDSGYHFLTSVIENLTNVVELGFSGQHSTLSNLPKKIFKAINKGLTNLGGYSSNRLEKIQYFNLTGTQNELVELIFSPLNNFLGQLKSIDLWNTKILNLTNGGKTLAGLITNIKSLQELRLQSSISSQAIAKEISDGLMRAKQIQYVDISNNLLITEKGLSQIIYNLAFSPKLTHLNISSCQITTFNEVVESLYKLLRITASLEVLNMKSILKLNQNLNKDFWVSLGEVKTLKVLDLSHSGVFSVPQMDLIGKAISFNAKKSGQLELFLTRATIQTYPQLESLIQSLSISEQDHENWYGDSTRAIKMSGGELEKKYYCNLQAFDLNLSTALQSNFNLAHFRNQFKPKDPWLTQFIHSSQKLVNLQISGRALKKNEAELLYLSLDPTRNNKQGYLKVLNLSKNELMKEGAKVIAQLLEVNTTIEQFDISANKIGVSGGKAIGLALERNRTLKQLNIFNNKIGFDGAQAFGKCLSVNSTLEFIEFGHNRIRNKVFIQNHNIIQGLLSIAQGIQKNKTSKIAILGLRFNFLNEEGIIELLKLLHSDQERPQLQELYIRNNLINEYGLFNLKVFYDENKFTTRLDLFQKIALTEESKLERTIWIHPALKENELKQFFETTHDCGVVVDVRTRVGFQYLNRDQSKNKFNFVEFADQNSLVRAMALASRRKTILSGVKFRVFKAGTGTYQYQKKSAKQKKAETSKTNVINGQAQKTNGERVIAGRIGSRGARGGKR